MVGKEQYFATGWRVVDFKKVFNRQKHAKLITKLGDCGVPAWLLRIMIVFLTERELIVAYKGKVSKHKLMPRRGLQGTVLGMILFLVLLNNAGYKKENYTITTKNTSSCQ